MTGTLDIDLDAVLREASELLGDWPLAPGGDERMCNHLQARTVDELRAKGICSWLDVLQADLLVLRDTWGLGKTTVAWVQSDAHRAWSECVNEVLSTEADKRMRIWWKRQRTRLENEPVSETEARDAWMRANREAKAFHDSLSG